MSDTVSPERRALMDALTPFHRPGMMWPEQVALDALEDAGLAIVPKEATEAMCSAGVSYFMDFSRETFAGLYRVMLRAK